MASNLVVSDLSVRSDARSRVRSFLLAPSSKARSPLRTVVRSVLATSDGLQPTSPFPSKPGDFSERPQTPDLRIRGPDPWIADSAKASGGGPPQYDLVGRLQPGGLALGRRPIG